MEHLPQFSMTDLLFLGSSVLFGITVFILTRMLYPERLLEEVKAKAAEAREQNTGEDRDLAPQPVPSPMMAVGNALVDKLGEYNHGLVKPAWNDKMKVRFTSMGRPDLKPQNFRAHQELWLFLFTILGLMLMNLFQQPLWYAIVFAVFGFSFPYIWLNDQIKKRHNAIARALPYNIDLLTLSVEAGLDFGAALGTVVEKGMPGPLLEEFNILLNEVRLGTTRSEALRAMADRIRMAEVSAFVANLVQADKMGTSLGKVLRIQSTQMRIARTHRAEKLANEAPIKMLLPLIGCIFPTVFLILFGPIVFRLMSGG